MRTCPNRNCRLIHDDEVGQCPECGASMSRKPDAEIDPNMNLYAASARAQQERALERRFNTRRPGTAEVIAETPQQVQDEAQEVAAGIMALYGLR